MKLASILEYIPSRLRQFFVGGPRVVIDSTLSVDELAGRFRETLQSGWGGVTGATGYVRGSRISVRWGTGSLFYDGFEPVFYGRLEKTSKGCRLTGHLTSQGYAQIFVGLMCGTTLLISIVFIWTIIVPLVCYGLLWMVNGMMCIGDLSYPNRGKKIMTYIRHTIAKLQRQRKIRNSKSRTSRRTVLSTNHPAANPSTAQPPTICGL